MSNNNFGYCADWKRVGAICEEQCERCAKAENMPEVIPDKPASIWFAVDEDGSEWWHESKPYRSSPNYWYSECHHKLPPIGAIKAITGRTLTWADEPIEWKPGESVREQTIKEVQELLLTQMHPMLHRNGYPSDAVPKANVLGLPGLMKIKQFKINKP